MRETLFTLRNQNEICTECLRKLQPHRTVRSNGMAPHQSREPSCVSNAHPGTGEITKVLITGGAGYLGHNLGSALVKLGYSVILFDKQKPELKGDIRDYNSLYKACEGVDCVFHAASFGMSGFQLLQRKQIESINIEGTQAVINVCTERNIPKLIYTSTVNVVFGGNYIEERDEETTSYYPPEKQLDLYSKTKTIAEQMILAANGTPLRNGSKLLTCVLRPPGIYGPHEKIFLPRLVAHAEKRLLCFKFWNDQTKMNWIHVYNLVDAHILAAEALTACKGQIASGKAYFIHDGEQVNFQTWFHPIFEKLGFSDPWIPLPSSLVYNAAVLIEYLHILLSPFVDISPLLTSNEVRNIAVMHTFRIDKARKELGYNPKKFSFADCVDLYIRSRPTQPKRKHNVSKILQALLCCFMCLCFCITFLNLYPTGSVPRAAPLRGK